MGWLRGKQPSFRLAGELKATDFQRPKAKPVGERRLSVSIGVIDDAPFEPKQNLENVGYRVNFLGDPQNLDIIVPHHIILCDLQGVGKSLDARNQGAFLIDEIRKKHPEKYVIAYTGSRTNLITRDARSNSDAFQKKDSDIEAWVDCLDGIIEKLLDPYEVWKRQRKALVDRDVDTLTILQLEDAFVKSLASRELGDRSELQRFIDGANVGSDVRAIVHSLIASGLFKLLIQ